MRLLYLSQTRGGPETERRKWGRASLFRDAAMSGVRATGRSSATAPSFAVYCDAWSRYSAAMREVRANGRPYASESKDGLSFKANPALGAIRDAASVLLRLGEEFGLTPLARPKVGAAEPVRDALDEFLARHRPR
jgi:P27 family predicted phage terminase small subunit